MRVVQQGAGAVSGQHELEVHADLSCLGAWLNEKQHVYHRTESLEVTC